MALKIAVLPGDGVGVEVTAEAVKVLKAIGRKFKIEMVFEEALIGGVAYDATGHPLPDETLALCKSSDAVLLGAVGGPKWDKIQPPSLRPEAGALLPLRRALGLFANLRPAKLSNALIHTAPLKTELIEGLDILVVRELTGGIYFGEPKERRDNGKTAVDTCVYTAKEIEQIAKVGFEAARMRRKQLTSVDKANVLETSRLWREVVIEVSAHYPDIQLNHMLVDNAAMQLVRSPLQFDVILTENMFGDILSDEAAMLTGSLGMLPSASLGEGDFGLYEPVHGSAPDIAGQNKANPMAAILSTAMLMRYTAHHEEAAQTIEKAVENCLSSGTSTSDIGGCATTSQVGDMVSEKV
ncbi:MAG: 3-isopropylmalate dehydrogenase [bacterium]|jgi:3-isopropylmalate dehydrogenase